MPQGLRPKERTYQVRARSWRPCRWRPDEPAEKVRELAHGLRRSRWANEGGEDMQNQTGRTGNDRANESMDAPTATTASKTAKEIGQRLAVLLDEIDEVLERNAGEFVAGYVQHGGE